MSKYDRWREVTNEYFKTVTKERLISDSMRVGILLVNRPSRVLGHTRTKPVAAKELTGRAKGPYRGTVRDSTTGRFVATRREVSVGRLIKTKDTRSSKPAKRSPQSSL